MINFLKYKWLYLLISFLVIIPGLISLIFFGLKPSVDFTGGTVWEIKFEKSIVPDKTSKDKPEQILQKFLAAEKINPSTSLRVDGEQSRTIKDPVVSASGDSFIIKSQEFDQKTKEDLSAKLKDHFGAFSESLFESIGPSLGQELLVKTMIGVVLASVLILLYITFRFGEKSFGVCATVATIHDSLVILGAFSLLGKFLGVEVDTLFVTAVLTVLSFSVHDTVVTYDRIRELTKLNPKNDIAANTNLAINQTLVRSLNNSLTVILVLLALILLGGETIKWFSVALLMGMITGTYSSICVAAPLLTVWQKRFVKKV